MPGIFAFSTSEEFIWSVQRKGLSTSDSFSQSVLSSIVFSTFLSVFPVLLPIQYFRIAHNKPAYARGISL
jgi:hypothetical protein